MQSYTRAVRRDHRREIAQAHERDTITRNERMAALLPSADERASKILQAAIYLVAARKCLALAGTSETVIAVNLALRSASRALHERNWLQ